MNTPVQYKPYPYLRVIVCFALFGGAVGGALLGLTATAVYGHSHELVVHDWRPLAGFMVFGSVIGLIPALLCGIWLAWRRRCRNLGGMAEAVLVGAAIGWLFICLTVGWQVPGFLMESWLFLVAGGGSALIVGGCVLPRQQP